MFTIPFACSDLSKTNVWANPLLKDPAIGDFHLLPNSPAIDVGDPADDHSQEPSCQGENNRINAGAYVNTNQATCKEKLGVRGPFKQSQAEHIGDGSVYSFNGRQVGLLGEFSKLTSASVGVYVVCNRESQPRIAYKII